MTTSSRRPTAPHRISGPGELLQAIPYLLGFHPDTSLVLVGLDAGALIVTARIDLADTSSVEVLTATIAALADGGASTIVAVVYPEVGDRTLGGDADSSMLCHLITSVSDEMQCPVLDVLIAAGGRFRSLLCTVDYCCPPDGIPVPQVPTAFATAATVEGMVALPDRAALVALLAPLSPAERARLQPAIETAEQTTMAVMFAGDGLRHERSVKRAIFAAARASAEPAWVPPAPAQLARFVVALGETAVRDAVWVAVDDRRLDGRPLWRELARRCPSPYDAAAFFLFGWASWRAGEGALANVAAERAVSSDSGYGAADLLLAVLDRGLDPRSFPRLRLRR